MKDTQKVVSLNADTNHRTLNDNPFSADVATAIMKDIAASEAKGEDSDFVNEHGILMALRVAKISIESNEKARSVTLTTPDDAFTNKNVTQLFPEQGLAEQQRHLAASIFYTLKDQRGRNPNAAEFYGAIVQRVIDTVGDLDRFK